MLNILWLVLTKDPTLLLLIIFEIWAIGYGARWAWKKWVPREPEWKSQIYEVTVVDGIEWLNVGPAPRDPGVCEECAAGMVDYGDFKYCEGCGRIED